ncbi:uncharacterized protein PADG_04530 [Paracoccidioides brasiliensis Pb18]|uniref:Uncharacterized protein n=2 Tax=Paracoccidioides brasiliensis TaxID=121759 RepID=C1GC08_PARBD|nr:uncharacterized protein PADG_04530 [Paracoccidioides brasiliensis Pb18]EEH48451.2 hypothetical protein PADG_04530 [Paracoccidioides brasiliensis Pb18]ODH21884.1 hypothetical protein ACO22_05605 [Paracoccidioides brasiliensis]ODH50036.1 hypothetical protein GX48_03841 [Paracoccidioides brasiliensis]
MTIPESPPPPIRVGISLQKDMRLLLSIGLVPSKRTTYAYFDGIGNRRFPGLNIKDIPLVIVRSVAQGVSICKGMFGVPRGAISPEVDLDNLTTIERQRYWFSNYGSPIRLFRYNGKLDFYHSGKRPHHSAGARDMEVQRARFPVDASHDPVQASQFPFPREPVEERGGEARGGEGNLKFLLRSH